MTRLISMHFVSEPLDDHAGIDHVLGHRSRSSACSMPLSVCGRKPIRCRIQVASARASTLVAWVAWASRMALSSACSMLHLFARSSPSGSHRVESSPSFLPVGGHQGGQADARRGHQREQGDRGADAGRGDCMKSGCIFPILAAYSYPLPERG